MRTRTFVLLSVSVVALTFAAAPALAQTEARPGEHGSTTPVEVTPFVSLGSSASSRVGGAVTFPWTATLSVEGEVGYRRAELNALSSSVNLLVLAPSGRPGCPLSRHRRGLGTIRHRGRRADNEPRHPAKDRADNQRGRRRKGAGQRPLGLPHGCALVQWLGTDGSRALAALQRRVDQCRETLTERLLLHGHEFHLADAAEHGNADVMFMPGEEQVERRRSDREIQQAQRIDGLGQDRARE